jgi:hypothetical protein
MADGPEPQEPHQPLRPPAQQLLMLEQRALFELGAWWRAPVPAPHRPG